MQKRKITVNKVNLVNYGGNISSLDSTDKTALHCFLDMQYHDKYSSLTHYSLEEATQVLKLLIKSTKDINQQTCYGITPLHSLCKKPYDKISIKFYNVLKSYGADQLTLSIHGGNLLHTISRSHPENFINESHFSALIKCIIDDGVDINVKDFDGCSPLLLAVKFSTVAIVSALLCNGADVNAVDKSHRSALHHLIIRAIGSIVPKGILKTLLLHNINIKLEDIHGKTALEYVNNLNEDGDKFVADSVLKKCATTTDRIIRLSKQEISWSISDFGTIHSLLSFMLNTSTIGPAFLCDEYSAIKKEIDLLMLRIATSINEDNESYLKYSPQLSGSVSENTKVGLPDEFDYLFIVNNHPEVVGDNSLSQPGFIHLKSPDDNNVFFKNGVLDRIQFVVSFMESVFKSLRKNEIWQGLYVGIDYYEMDQFFYKKASGMDFGDAVIDRPNFLLHLKYPSKTCNGIISVCVDMVPAFEIYGFVPANFITNHTPSRHFAVPKSNVLPTCNPIDHDNSLHQMRISASAIETVALLNTSINIRMTFMVLKIFADKLSYYRYNMEKTSLEIGTYELKTEILFLIEKHWEGDDYEDSLDYVKLMDYIVEILKNIQKYNCGFSESVSSYFFPRLSIVEEAKSRTISYLDTLLNDLSALL